MQYFYRKALVAFVPGKTEVMAVVAGLRGNEPGMVS
jgi:hypothetical protein